MRESYLASDSASLLGLSEYDGIYGFGAGGLEGTGGGFDGGPSGQDIVYEQDLGSGGRLRPENACHLLKPLAAVRSDLPPLAGAGEQGQERVAA